MRHALIGFIALAGCSSGSGHPVLPTGNFAVVTTSGGMGAGGAVNTIRLSDKMVVKGLDTTIDQDNNVRIAGGKAYVLNRGPGTLRVYDVKTWTAPVEIPTGDATAAHATSNPEDVLPIAGTTRVYVTMNGNDAAHALGVLDTATPSAGVVKWIPLPTAAADTDGHSEPFSMYACAGKVYVLMGDYDQMTYAPTGPARLAIVDSASDAQVGFITLTTQSPAAIAAESDDCHDVLVANSGPFGKAPDGTAAIERVDLAQKRSLGVVISDAALQGRPSTLTIVSRTLAFSAIYYDLQPTAMGSILSSTKVISFDPTSGRMLGDVTGAAPFIPFTAATTDGHLLVGVDAYTGSIASGKLGSGLYLGKADGTMMPVVPIDLGQNPYAIAFQ